MSIAFLNIATMKLPQTFLFLLLTIISLVLIVGDCSVHSDTFSKRFNPINKECTSPSDLLADSNMGSFEDDEAATVSKTKSSRHCPFLGLIPTSDASFNSYFTTSIWQPPRFS